VSADKTTAARDQDESILHAYAFFACNESPHREV
jgi:hypothetical protein